MKKQRLILTALGIAIYTFGQTNQSEKTECDCPSCLAKAEGKTLPYTLPALQELNEPKTKEESHDEHADCDHDHAAAPEAHDAHAGDDLGAEVGPHAGHDPEIEIDPHAGHDHGAVEGIEITSEMVKKIGLQIHEAEEGVVARSVTFPAEIELNRDRMAAVSPRYASVVRQVFAEIGDEVKKGDLLASLENRETMSVYSVAAPLDGVIISKSISVGEIAGDDAVLFEVADLSTVWANVSIFPQYQHRVRKGMAVEFVAHDGHRTRGTVKYMSPIIAEKTRTFTARCVLVGAAEDFTPGAFVRAKIALESAQVSVAIPKEAIQILEGESVVFVPSDHGFQTVVVELGLTDENTVEITSGLHLGDRYVATGAFALKAQMVTSGMDPHAGHGH